MNRIALLLTLSLSLALFACAEKREPLPGDSVQTDGAVSLAPPRLATNATSPPVAREPLSAIESRLYPAELVMEHAAELAITPSQRDAITKELDKSQAELVKLQWDLQTEKDHLVKILDDAKVDETKSRAAAAALMQRENAIKGAHLGLLVRIKNVLTAEQQAKLRGLREAERCAPGATPGDAGRD